MYWKRAPADDLRPLESHHHAAITTTSPGVTRRVASPFVHKHPRGFYESETFSLNLQFRAVPPLYLEQCPGAHIWSSCHRLSSPPTLRPAHQPSRRQPSLTAWPIHRCVHNLYIYCSLLKWVFKLTRDCTTRFSKIVVTDESRKPNHNSRQTEYRSALYFRSSRRSSVCHRCLAPLMWG
jgi:hypothetical protein